MLVSEILTRKRYLDKKLVDLDTYLDALSILNIEDKITLYNKAIEEKFKLLTKIRSHVTLLETLNADNVVDVGGNKVTVSDAVKLRDTLSEKIRTLDNILRYGDFKVVNIFSLADQRDGVFEEYIVLDSIVIASDCTLDWNAEGDTE